MQKDQQTSAQWSLFDVFKNYLAVMVLACCGVVMQTTGVAAQEAGRLSLAGRIVDLPFFEPTIPVALSGPVDTLEFNLEVETIGATFANNLRLEVTDPDGNATLVSAATIPGWATAGTVSFFGTFPITTYNGTGIWTVSLTDAVPDSGAFPENSFLAGSYIAFRNDDLTAPTPVITSSVSDPTATTPIPVTVTFDEAVTGFVAADVTVGNGAVSDFAGTGTTYTFNVTPAADGPVTVDVAAGVAEDASGNGNVAAPQFAVDFDATAPSVTIATDPPGLASPTNQTPIPMTVTFDEPVTGFAATDIVVGNGAVSGFAGSADSYTFDLVPAADGAVTVDIAAGVAQDATGNDNTAAAPFAITFDGTASGLVIGGVPATYLPGDVFDVTFTFSEDITGFDETDVAVTGGTLSGFAATSATVYTAVVTPDGTGDVTVAVATGAGVDPAGNPSDGASATSVLQAATVASEQIAYFMENRAHALLDAQPDILRQLDGRSTGGFDAVASQGLLSLDFASPTGGTWWSTLRASSTETPTQTLRYGLLTIGANAYQTDRLVIGTMLQIDAAEQISQEGIRVKGNGALAGPYLAAQLGDQPLFFEGRLLYGRSKNEITPVGTYTDSFTTTRRLAKVGLSGSYDVGGITLFPQMNVSYTDDRQHAYTDGLGNRVPAQSVALTEVDLGVNFEAPLQTSRGEMVFTGGMARVWSRMTGTGPARDVINAGTAMDGRANFGLRYTDGNGLSVATGVYLSGLRFDRPSDRQSFGAELLVEYKY